MCVFCYATTALIAIPVALPIYIYKKIKKHRSNKIQNQTKLNSNDSVNNKTKNKNEKTS